MTIIQRNIKTLFHPTKKRYAIYQLLENTDTSEWCAMSRSGIISIPDMNIKTGLVSGKIYDSSKQAEPRFSVLVSSAIKRGFIINSYNTKSSPEKSWNDAVQNLEKKAFEKKCQGTLQSPNHDQYTLLIRVV